MFDYHVLDMFEFEITSLIPMEKFKVITFFYSYETQLTNVFIFEDTKN